VGTSVGVWVGLDDGWNVGFREGVAVGANDLVGHVVGAGVVLGFFAGHQCTAGSSVGGSVGALVRTLPFWGLAVRRVLKSQGRFMPLKQNVSFMYALYGTKSGSCPAKTRVTTPPFSPKTSAWNAALQMEESVLQGP
jgi:hypothetical protein